jgi:hypothetical protein
MHIMPQRPCLVASAIALLGLFAPLAHAVTITEDFNQYTASSTPVTGLTAVPGFGTTGNGWLEGWRTASTPNATAGVTVINTSPLNSGGNYFSATLTSNATTGTTPANDAIGLGKAYDVAGNSLASATAIYTNFDVRVDSITSTMQFDILDNGARGTGNVNGSWQVRAVNGLWYVLNGSNAISTGLTFNTGTTYSFSIVSNPTTFKWDYTISDGSTSVSGSDLSFRVSTFVTDTATGSVGGRWFLATATETSDVSSQSTTFSLDNISIGTSSPIPESSTYALLAGVVSLTFVLAGRRQRR